MKTVQEKPTHFKMIALTLLLLLASCISIGFAVVYYIQHDRYYWLVDNDSTMTALMVLMGLAFSSCLLANLYSLYVWDNLDQYFHLIYIKNSSNAVRFHGSLLGLKISKVIVTLLCLILISLGSYDLATAHARFQAKGLLGAMKSYKSQSRVKAAIDHLQISFQCCGHKSFTSWTDPDVIIEPGPLDVGSQNFRFVPFSCCRSPSHRPCVHDQVMSRNPDIHYEYPRDVTLHPNGCSSVLASSYSVLLKGIVSITGIIIALEVLALISYFTTALSSSPKTPGSLKKRIFLKHKKDRKPF